MNFYLINLSSSLRLRTMNIFLTKTIIPDMEIVCPVPVVVLYHQMMEEEEEEEEGTLIILSTDSGVIGGKYTQLPAARQMQRLMATGGGGERGFSWKIGQEDLALLLGAAHKDSVSSLAFSHDGEFLALGSMDGMVQVWDEFGDLKWELEGPGEGIVVRREIHEYHTEGLSCLAINPSSTLALPGSEDGSTHIVNITTGRVINTLASRSSLIRCVEFASRMD